MIIDTTRLTQDAINELVDQDVARYAAGEHPGWPRVEDRNPVLVTHDDPDAMTEDLTNAWRLVFEAWDKESAALQTA